MTHYIPLYFGRTVLVLPSIELARFYHLSLLPPEIGLGKKIARVIPGRFYFPNSVAHSFTRLFGVMGPTAFLLVG
jgi:hypothetical protein